MRPENYPVYSTLKAFKNHYYMVRNAYSKLEGSSFSFNLHMQGDQLQVENTFPNEEDVIHFFTLMRRFLDSRDSLFYAKIWEILKEHFGEIVTPEHIHQYETLLESIQQGIIPIHYENREGNADGQERILDSIDITAEMFYHLYSEGEFFNKANLDARAFFQYLERVPFVRPMLMTGLHRYHADFFHIISVFMGFILAAQRNDLYRQQFFEGNQEDNLCIFCKSTTNEFSSEEHIIPETLGNHDLVLPPGYVCNKCNNEMLARLDNALMAYPPIAIQRIYYTPYNKDGKRPSGQFGDMTITKTRPLHLHVQTKDETSEAFNIIENMADGSVRFRLNYKFKYQLDAKLLARAIYKIGLEMVALTEGRDAACSDKYDQARAFVLKGEGFPNNLLMSYHEVQPPFATGIEVTLSDGTYIVVKLYGVIFIINLEPTPVLELGEPLRELGIECFPLHKKPKGKKKREGQRNTEQTEQA